MKKLVEFEFFWHETDNLSSIVIEVLRTVFIFFFFFMKDILSVKNTNKSI